MPKDLVKRTAARTAAQPYSLPPPPQPRYHIPATQPSPTQLPATQPPATQPPATQLPATQFTSTQLPSTPLQAPIPLSRNSSASSACSSSSADSFFALLGTMVPIKEFKKRQQPHKKELRAAVTLVSFTMDPTPRLETVE